MRQLKGEQHPGTIRLVGLTYVSSLEPPPVGSAAEVWGKREARSVTVVAVDRSLGHWPIGESFKNIPPKPFLFLAKRATSLTENGAHSRLEWASLLMGRVSQKAHSAEGPTAVVFPWGCVPGGYSRGRGPSHRRVRAWWGLRSRATIRPVRWWGRCAGFPRRARGR